MHAGAIALAILLGLVEGCPLPRPHEVEDWQRGYVGILRPIQEVVLAPVAWLPRELQITQRFALFQAASSERFRFVIRGRSRGGGTRTLFRAGDDAGPYAAVLAHRRVRGVWNPQRRPPAQYPAFTRWFARRAFADDPALVEVTFAFERLAIDDGVPRPTGELAFVTAIPRASVPGAEAEAAP